MAERNNILYEVESRSDLAELQQVIQELRRIGDSLDTMADEAHRTADAQEDVAEATRGLKDEVGGLGKAWSFIKGLGIVGLLASIVGLVKQGITAVQDWAIGVDNLAQQFAITHEEATALATSWRLAGISAEEGAAMMSGFQGRLIDELEAQKEAAKRVAEIQEQRVDVLADLAKAEENHEKKLTDLYAQQAELQNTSFDEVVARRDEQLAELEADYQRYLEDQRYAEEQETKRLEAEWQERARRYERAFEDLRDELADKARSARNFREWNEAVQQYKKKQDRLREDMEEERKKLYGAADERVAQAERAAEREKEVYEQKKQAIMQKADEELAKERERQAQALAAVEERIAAENEAWDEQQAGFGERLSDLDKAQAEAAAQGAGLKYIMEQLGVSMFDAEGNMRPVDELLWDMKEALAAMPEGAEKAAIIADLGWEDMAYWINEGAGATESLKFAQENGLVVTQETIDAIREQNRLMAEAQLQMIGMGMTLAEQLGAFEHINTFLGLVNIGLERLSQLITILTTEGGFDALIQGLRDQYDWFDKLAGIIEWLIDKFNEAMEVANQLATIFSTEGGAGQLFEGLGQAIGEGLAGQAGALGFQTGGAVPGTGPHPAIIHGGEYVVPREGALVLGGGQRPVTVNIMAPVYGVEDLQRAIAGAIARADRQGVAVGVR